MKKVLLLLSVFCLSITNVKANTEKTKTLIYYADFLFILLSSMLISLIITGKLFDNFDMV